MPSAITISAVRSGNYLGDADRQAVAAKAVHRKNNTVRTSSPQLATVARGTLVVALAGGAGALLTHVLSWHHEDWRQFLGVDPYALVLLAGLTVMAVGSYIVWPSVWNIPGHLQLGLAVSAYFVPLLLGDSLEGYPIDTIRQYAGLVAVGAGSFLLGLLGARWLWRSRAPSSLRRMLTPSVPSIDVISQRALWVLVAGCLGLTVSYAVIGFVPLLTKDPITAKFLRGEYQQSYLVVAPLYRFSLYTLQALVPVGLACWYVRRDARLLMVSGVALLLIMGAGNRGPALTGIVVFIGLLAARHRAHGILFVGAIAIGFPLIGSTLFYLLGAAGLEGFTRLYDSTIQATGLVSLISAGTPDVVDHLKFLVAYEHNSTLTYGRTFVGALVPYGFEWNPGVWTLGVLFPGVDSSQIGSGGLRLPVPFWGLTAFGPVGSAAIPFLSGLVLGAVTAAARDVIPDRSLPHTALAIGIYTVLGLQLAQFYLLTIYTLPALVALLYVGYLPLRQLRGADERSGPRISASPRARAAGPRGLMKIGDP